MLCVRAPEWNDEKSSGKFFFFIRIRKECRKSLRAIKTRYYVKYSTYTKVHQSFFSFWLNHQSSTTANVCIAFVSHLYMPKITPHTNLCNFQYLFHMYSMLLLYFALFVEPTKKKFLLSYCLLLVEKLLSIFFTLTQFAVFSENHVLIMFCFFFFLLYFNLHKFACLCAFFPLRFPEISFVSHHLLEGKWIRISRRRFVCEFSTLRSLRKSFTLLCRKVHWFFFAEFISLLPLFHEYL